MTPNGLFQIALFCAVLLLSVKPLGAYMARVFEGERTLLSPALSPLENGLYKLFGVSKDDDQTWVQYAFSLLAFSLVGLLLTYVFLRLQGMLPFNPQGYGARQMPADLAFNTSASFTTNTNWQSYAPDYTLSYFSNMVALAIHNWMSAAAGMAVAIALVRGIARRNANGIGNFWVDATRSILYILAPICLVYALFLVAQGVPQNFSAYTQVTTLEGTKQTLAQGPVASQEAIKMLGTNGGGFFNANSAHPFENPTPLTNLIQMLSIFLIPAALTYTFGKMVGNTKQGWALLGAMFALFIIGAGVCYNAEAAGNPLVHALGVPGGNMEGKETRFGIANSALFAVVTTDASCGAVNAMHDSFTPIGGLVPLLNILSGECIFGGVGAGLYGMLMFAILAVFIAGLMVGRTPEYIGKKIEGYEVKMAMLAVLVLAASILGFAALGANGNLPTDGKTTLAALNQFPATAYGSASDTFYGATYNNINNSGPHGLSEILYAFTSATGNNGSAFAGITANTPFYNVTLGLAMLVGRFLMIIPLLAIAGSLAKKKYTPSNKGTFPTDSGTFVAVLCGTIVIVGALTYFPVLALGPVVEHYLMNAGKTF
ncbi:potassium-transporting ATPase potassium-binding subunit [Abditibacteriota bacterium]|nr:potassium-transporting ATPase potassium-binding subunit [Abditibacteriota bacterium]